MRRRAGACVRAREGEGEGEGESPPQGAPTPPKRRVVRRTAAPGRKLSDDEKLQAKRALALRDCALRIKPIVDDLLVACADNQVRRAQELKLKLNDALGGDEFLPAVPERVHIALLTMYAANKLSALAERAFADALRAGAEVSDEDVWRLVECFEDTGDVKKAETVLAYMEARRAP
jgi:hypothetical protein